MCISVEQSVDFFSCAAHALVVCGVMDDDRV